jgi:hypothetical protein
MSGWIESRLIESLPCVVNVIHIIHESADCHWDDCCLLVHQLLEFLVCQPLGISATREQRQTLDILKIAFPLRIDDTVDAIVSTTRNKTT